MVGVPRRCNLCIPVGCTLQKPFGPRLQQNKRPTAATLGGHTDQLQTGHCYGMLRLCKPSVTQKLPSANAAGYEGGGSGDPAGKVDGSRLNVSLVFHVPRNEAHYIPLYNHHGTRASTCNQSSGQHAYA